MEGVVVVTSSIGIKWNRVLLRDVTVAAKVSVGGWMTNICVLMAIRKLGLLVRVPRFGYLGVRAASQNVQNLIIIARPLDGYMQYLL